MIAALYGVMTLLAFVGFVVAIFGSLNDRTNRYPLPLLLASAVLGALAQALL